jgi:hypothetical protein
MGHRQNVDVWACLVGEVNAVSNRHLPIFRAKTPACNRDCIAEAQALLACPTDSAGCLIEQRQEHSQAMTEVRDEGEPSAVRHVQADSAQPEPRHLAVSDDGQRLAR